jgi:hypothetical protein
MMRCFLLALPWEKAESVRVNEELESGYGGCCSEGYGGSWSDGYGGC